MLFKYGIYQSSSRSCIFYKEDEDGNQSIFNLFVNPNDSNKKIFAYIDNDQMREKSWFEEKEIAAHEIINKFRKWAIDAPVVFELNAQKGIVNCLKSALTSIKKE